MRPTTLYDTLNISRDASADAINAAYKALARQHHPDRNHDDPKAHEKMAAINISHEILSSDAKRREYDHYLKNLERIYLHKPRPKARSAVIKRKSLRQFFSRKTASFLMLGFCFGFCLWGIVSKAPPVPVEITQSLPNIAPPVDVADEAETPVTYYQASAAAPPPATHRPQASAPYYSASGYNAELASRLF